MPKNPPRVVQAWHFLYDERYLRDGTPVHVGRLYRLPKGQRPKICSRGYHASEHVASAMGYVAGHWLCRVELSGKFDDPDYPTDKLVASERRILWMVDMYPIARAFLAELADEVLAAEAEAGHAADYPYFLAWASFTARAYLGGFLTDAELAAARAEAKEGQTKLRQSLITALKEERMTGGDADRILAVTDSVLRCLSSHPVDDLSGLFGSLRRLQLLVPAFTEDYAQLNARLEEQILALAPTTLPKPPKAKRWDRAKKLRKPKAAKTELAKSLAPSILEVEALEKRAQRALDLWVKRSKATNALRDLHERKTLQLERLVREQTYPDPKLSLRQFHKKLDQLAAEIRADHAARGTALQLEDKARYFFYQHVSPAVRALPEKEYKALQERLDRYRHDIFYAR